ncbi:MAG: hypothetical protein MJ000_05845 [Bacteroidales bacterium]|nr:hypothetical protein [Bacteroidales bacterium]
MNKILFLICLLMTSFVVDGQDFVCGRYVSTCYFYEGIKFELKSSTMNYWELANEFYTHKIHNEGKKAERTFLIDEIPISENDYRHLKLRKRDFVVDSNYCTEDYVFDSIVVINLHAKLSIPILIDGVEYNYQDTIPAEYLNGDKLYFRRERRFFRKDRIIVEKERR